MLQGHKKNLGRTILVIGATYLDQVVVTDQVPSWDTVSTVTDYYQTLGGKGANVAVCLSQLGSRVSLVSGVGLDEAGNRCKRQLQEMGVDISNVKSFENPTGTVIILSDGKGREGYLPYKGANYQLDSEYLQQIISNYQEISAIYINTELTVEVIATAIVSAAEKHIPICIDLGPKPEKVPQDILSKCTWITANEIEAKSYLAITKTKETATRDACIQLSNIAREGAIITLGAKGCCYKTRTDKEIEYVPASLVQNVRSTIGAGDAFRASFLHDVRKHTLFRQAVINAIQYSGSVIAHS